MGKLYLLFVVSMALGLSSTGVAKSNTLTATLKEQHSSGVSGTALLTDKGHNNTMIQVQLQGDPKGGRHPMHLHEGVCTGTIPTIRYPLHDVVKGKSKTVIHASIQDLKSEPLYFNIHESAHHLGKVITCGAVQLPVVPKTGAGGLPTFAIKPEVFGLAIAGLVLAVAVLMIVRTRSGAKR